MIGFLDSQSRTFADVVLPAFRQGLKDYGYVESENVAIEYRWAENQIDRLPALAADLVRRQVAVIATLGGNTASVATRPINENIRDAYLGLPQRTRVLRDCIREVLRLRELTAS